MSAARPLVALALLAAVAAAPAAAPSPSSAGPPVPASASTPAPPTSADDAAIVAVYPNPVRDGDRGEFVVARVPSPGNWSLSDGEAVVRIPANVSGTVVLAAHPAAVRPLVDRRVVRVADRLALANAGETVELRRDGRVLDSATYEDAPESERYRPGHGFAPLGATDFGVETSGPVSVRPFVLPDAPGVPVETLRSADRRVLLGAYTLTSRRVVDALAAAHERGVRVRVLVEGGPVGGIARREARLLDRLVRAGVPVRVLDGPRARYDHHHAKYAVVDDRALVLSENFKPSGTGGRASRGWGVVVDDAGTAAHLARVFRADAGWLDARNWTAFRSGRSFERIPPANGSYPDRFAPERVRAESVRVLVAPDNAEAAILDLLDSANDSLLVQQASVGGRDTPFLRATLAAARRGVRVRVLLSSAWYVREENRRLVEWLNGRADAAGLDLEARLADPRGRFEKVHNKGVVVDGEHALVGSVNWNVHAARQNREVAVVLDGERVAGYYARVFRADWRGGGRQLPAGLVLAVVVAAAVAVRFARQRITFERPYSM